jgi:hypothetical protein
MASIAAADCPPCDRIASEPISSPAASHAARWIQLFELLDLALPHVCATGTRAASSADALAGGLLGRIWRPSIDRAARYRPRVQRRQEVNRIRATQQVLAKRPAITSDPRSRVAGGDQPEVELERAVPPTRSISRSGRARGSLAWRDAVQRRARSMARTDPSRGQLGSRPPIPRLATAPAAAEFLTAARASR